MTVQFSGTTSPGFVVNVAFDTPGLPISHYEEIGAPHFSFVRNEPSGCWRIAIRDAAGLGAVVASGWFSLRVDGIRCESIWVKRQYPVRLLAEYLCDWAVHLWQFEHSDRNSAIMHAVEGTLPRSALQMMLTEGKTCVDPDQITVLWDRPDGQERVGPDDKFWLASRQTQWHPEV